MLAGGSASTASDVFRWGGKGLACMLGRTWWLLSMGHHYVATAPSCTPLHPSLCSFGVVLWELLTWCLPWEGRNAFQVSGEEGALQRRCRW